MVDSPIPSSRPSWFRSATDRTAAGSLSASGRKLLSVTQEDLIAGDDVQGAVVVQVRQQQARRLPGTRRQFAAGEIGAKSQALSVPVGQSGDTEVASQQDEIDPSVAIHVSGGHREIVFRRIARDMLSLL